MTGVMMSCHLCLCRCLLGILTLTLASLATSDETVVRLSLGSIQGTVQYALNKATPVYTFRGIPYALPPVNELRFRSPKSVKSWDHVMQATKFGPACLQPLPLTQKSLSPLTLTQTEEDETSEDCLFLNVFTPSLNHSQNLPVLVWIHTGDYSTGMGSLFDGTALAALEDVVVVTFNYRLGVFGFFSTRDDASPGNYGLLDQIEVLAWVRTHINKFGGDPKRVTLGGHRAGAVSVSLHMVSPLSRGLFHAAIAQSGTSLTSLIQTADHRDRAVLFTELVSQCKMTPKMSSSDMAECLRHIPSSELLRVQSHMQHKLQTFLPAIDGYFLTNLPHNLYLSHHASPLPYLTGLTSHEGFYLAQLRNRDYLKESFMHRTAVVSIQDWMRYFDYAPEDVMEEVSEVYLGGVVDDVTALRKSYSGIVGDMWMTAPLHLTASLHAVSAPVYLYSVTYKPSFSTSPEWIMGATHLEDLPLLWGCHLLPNHSPCSELKLSTEDAQLSLTMMRYWGQFIRIGEPASDTDPVWPAYNSTDHLYLQLDISPSARDTSNIDYLTLWNKKYIQPSDTSSPSDYVVDSGDDDDDDDVSVDVVHNNDTVFVNHDEF